VLILAAHKRRTRHEGAVFERADKTQADAYIVEAGKRWLVVLRMSVETDEPHALFSTWWADCGGAPLKLDAQTLLDML
jgi:hypothetical protein